MAEIMAEIKGLKTRVTSLEMDNSRGTNQILARIERVESQMKEFEGAGGEGIGARAKGSSGGFRSVFNKHPLLKVCNVMMSLVPFVLKTSACGAYDFFSDVQSGGVREQGEMHQ